MSAGGLVKMDIVKGNNTQAPALFRREILLFCDERRSGQRICNGPRFRLVVKDMLTLLSVSNEIEDLINIDSPTINSIT